MTKSADEGPAAVPPYLVIKQHPDDRAADQAAMQEQAALADRLGEESVARREEARRKAAQDQLDLQIRKDGDRLAALVRAGILTDEEIDAILSTYHEKYSRRSFMPEGVTGGFGSVLRRALVSA